jgi:PAS domain S-box-containing protein
MVPIRADDPEQRRHLYDLFVHSVKDFAIFLLDKDGCIITWNEGGERVLGYTAEEILGKHLSMFYTEEDRANCVVERELKQAQDEGRASDDRWLVHKDGRSVWVNGVTVSLREAACACYGKIIHDATEMRHKQERIEKLNEALQDKISELEQFEDATVGRELRMIELKREMERLKDKIRTLETRHT